MSWLGRIGRAVTVAAVVVMGLLVAMFVRGCSSDERHERKPPPPQGAQARPPASQPAATSPEPGPGRKPPAGQVSSTEVEQGQPLPRNYVE